MIQEAQQVVDREVDGPRRTCRPHRGRDRQQEVAPERRPVAAVLHEVAQCRVRAGACESLARPPIEAHDVGQQPKVRRASDRGRFREPAPDATRAELEPTRATRRAKRHVAGLTFDPELGQHPDERRVGPLVEDDEAGIDGHGAVGRRDLFGLDVPADVPLAFVQPDLVTIAQGVRRAQAAHPRSDDGDLHAGPLPGDTARSASVRRMPAAASRPMRANTPERNGWARRRKPRNRMSAVYRIRVPTPSARRRSRRRRRPPIRYRRGPHGSDAPERRRGRSWVRFVGPCGRRARTANRAGAAPRRGGRTGSHPGSQRSALAKSATKSNEVSSGRTVSICSCKRVIGVSFGSRACFGDGRPTRPDRCGAGTQRHRVVLEHRLRGAPAAVGWSEPREGALVGRTVLITGPTSGLGQAASVVFAELGARLVLLGRDAGKLEVDSVRTSRLATRRPQSPRWSPTCRRSRASAQPRRRCAPASRGSTSSSIMRGDPDRRIVTADGVEATFATMVVGPFRLLAEVLPLLRAAGGARVIAVTSGGMYAQPLDLTDLGYERGVFDGTRAYARAKRAQVALVREWARRLRPAPEVLTVNAMHPGWAGHARPRGVAPGLRARHAPDPAHAGRRHRHAGLAGRDRRPRHDQRSALHDRRPRALRSAADDAPVG